MESMAQYLDRAKAATSTQSDSNLGRKIGVGRSSIYEWRHGHSYPSESTMLRLAERANLDPQEALILLNLWKAEGEAKDVYKRLLKSTIVQAKDRAKKFGATIALALVFSSPLAGNDAQAAGNTQFFEELPRAENSHNAEIINIMRLPTEFVRGFKSKFVKLLSLIAAPLGLGVLA